MTVTERRAVVALGANLGEPRASFARALDEIERDVGPILARSAFVETAPLVLPGDDPAKHPPYLNGAVLVGTTLAPDAILTALHRIEQGLGRDRARESARWQPRTIDLDLIALDDLVLDTPSLVLPHPRMQEREFVLAPLVEIWPDWRHPRLGRTATALLDELRSATK